MLIEAHKSRELFRLRVSFYSWKGVLFFPPIAHSLNVEVRVNFTFVLFRVFVAMPLDSETYHLYTRTRSRTRNTIVNTHDRKLCTPFRGFAIARNFGVTKWYALGESFQSEGCARYQTNSSKGRRAFQMVSPGEGASQA